MADTCVCPNSVNISCRGGFGIGVYQPECQIIPNGDRVGNPYYDTDTDTSYYTYGVLLNCGTFSGVPVGDLEEFFVPVCQNIPLESVVAVDQILDSCPSFTPVLYDFVNSGGQPPPTGYQFLRIRVDDELQEGGCGQYRIALSGRYDPDVTTDNIIFTVVTSDRLSNFGAGAQFLLASCPPLPRLTVNKSCETVIANNRATLNYSVIVSNTGDADLTNVAYDDIINFDGSNITLGNIVVTPDTISVDTSVSGVIMFSGNLGDINIGQSVNISYTIALQAFAAPNTYTFNNLAIASSSTAEGSSECITDVEVVAITTNNCCNIDGNMANFIVSLTNQTNSPNTEIVVENLLTVPRGLTVNFTSFGNCQAFFDGTTNEVPLNEAVTNSIIRVICTTDLTVNETVNFEVDFEYVSINDLQQVPAILTYLIDGVFFVNSNEQILLSVAPLPNEQTINVNSDLMCN